MLKRQPERKFPSPELPPPPSAQAKEQRYIQSIEIGFRLLDVLRQAPGKMALKDLSQRAGMTPTKAHLYLAAFTRVGMVEQEAATSKYGLGPAAVHLGLAAISQLDLVSASQSVLEQLHASFEVSVCLAIWGDVGPTIVRKMDPRQALPNSLRLGSSLPLLWSSTGHIYLAHGAGTPLHRLLEREIAGRSEYRARAVKLSELVRQQGYAWSESQMNQGYAAIAAPIFDHENQLVAVLTLVGLGPLIDRRAKSPMVSALIAGARKVSETMGHVEESVPMKAIKNETDHRHRRS